MRKRQNYYLEVVYMIITKLLGKAVKTVIGDTVFVCACTYALLIDPIKKKIF